MIIREVMDIVLEPGQLPTEVGAVIDNDGKRLNVSQKLKIERPAKPFIGQRRIDRFWIEL